MRHDDAAKRLDALPLNANTFATTFATTFARKATQPMPPGFEPFLQLGAVGLLLYYFIQDRKENVVERASRQLESKNDRTEMAKSLRAIAVTNVTLQQMFLVVSVAKTGKHGDNDDCVRLNQSTDAMIRMLESQRVELTKVFETK